MMRVFIPVWACGAVGSALPWHGRGQGFESLQVHQNHCPIGSTNAAFPAILAALAACFGLATDAGASLILNGGFESGLTDWTSQTRVSGSGTGVCNSAFASQSTGAGCATLTNPVDGGASAYSSITMTSSTPANTEWVNDRIGNIPGWHRPCGSL